MKILTLTIAMILFASCRRQNPNSYPRINTQEQLSPVFSVVEIDEKEYIDIESSKCLSRNYQINRDVIGPVDDTVLVMDIRECDRMIGYAPQEYATFTTWLESMRQWLLSWL